uniref:Odorant-binding protein 12 n=1 Tax=Ceracris kiangsu TaxID=227354 RepID=A0A6M6DT04_CERKI|nr:odorant-binding protein 12 [Ceracris kiangsu]
MFHFYAITFCCLLWLVFHCSVNCSDINIWRKCNETYPVPDATLISFRNNGTIPDENNVTSRCFTDCYGKKTCMLTSDGGFNWTTLEHILSNFKMKHSAMDIFGKCKHDPSDDVCLQSYLSLQCVAETILSLINAR